MLNCVQSFTHCSFVSHDHSFPFFVSHFLKGPGLKPPAENTLQYLEEVAVQTAKYVTKKKNQFWK